MLDSSLGDAFDDAMRAAWGDGNDLTRRSTAEARIVATILKRTQLGLNELCRRTSLRKDTVTFAAFREIFWRFPDWWSVSLFREPLGPAGWTALWKDFHKTELYQAYQDALEVTPVELTHRLVLAAGPFAGLPGRFLLVYQHPLETRASFRCQVRRPRRKEIDVFTLTSIDAYLEALPGGWEEPGA